MEVDGECRGGEESERRGGLRRVVVAVGEVETNDEVVGGESVGWLWDKGKWRMWGSGREVLDGEGKVWWWFYMGR